MKVKLGNFEFEGTSDELQNITQLLDTLIPQANKIVVIATSTAPATTSTTTAAPIETT